MQFTRWDLGICLIFISQRDCPKVLEKVIGLIIFELLLIFLPKELLLLHMSLVVDCYCFRMFPLFRYFPVYYWDFCLLTQYIYPKTSWKYRQLMCISSAFNEDCFLMDLTLSENFDVKLWVYTWDIHPVKTYLSLVSTEQTVRGLQETQTSL